MKIDHISMLKAYSCTDIPVTKSFMNLDLEMPFYLPSLPFFGIAFSNDKSGSSTLW